jgi:hypothetical protein
MSLQVRAHGSNYFSLGHRASRFLISSVSQLNISRRLLENKVGQTWGGKKSNLTARRFSAKVTALTAIIPLPI